MRLVLTIPAGSGAIAQARSIALREEGIDVGGASDCDAVVDHPTVGTARVRIERRGEHWVVIDRDGRGACSVGGVPLRAREPRIVRPPHTLRLGDVDLGLSFDAVDSSQGSQAGATREVALRAAAFLADVAPNGPRVRVVEGPLLGATLELLGSGPYLVGRGAHCHLLLDAVDASREHFSIACEGDRVVVRDLGTARGTFLGRSRLVPNHGAVWAPSRMLRAADAVFALEMASEATVERLLVEPLARVPDEPRSREATHGASSADDVASEPAREESLASASVAPALLPELGDDAAFASSRGVVSRNGGLPPRASRGKDRIFMVVVAVVVLAVAAAAALSILLLW